MIPAGDFTPVMAMAIIAIAVREHGLDRLAWGIWIAALGAWMVLTPSAIRAGRRGAPGPSGAWLLLVVATQSLAIVAGGGLLPVPLSGPAVVLLVLGAAACVVVLARIAHEWRRRPHLAAWRADGWIVMGALAITAVAGSELHGALALLLPWAAATLSIPVLAGLDAAALRARGGGIARESDRWAMAFPLAMWSVAAHAVARRFGVPAADAAGAVALGAAAVAWLLAARATAAGLRSGQMSAVS